MRDYTQIFAEALARLNPAQRQAVDTLEGPVLVFAGPGTGKTQVLTLRIGNLIRQGLSEPEGILALTFTNAAAANMRERLHQYIGPAALKVNFHTFHDFCQEVISSEPEAFPFRQDAQALGDLERIAILQEIIDKLDLKALRPAGKKYYYLGAITKAIQDLKQEYVTTSKYRELLAVSEKKYALLIEEEQAKKRPSKAKLADYEKTIARQRELAEIYEEYVRILDERARYDFADMILQVVEVFRRDEAILAKYQEKFQYLLVDEYQDTNASQDAVLDLLAAFWGEQANVFAVGDPFQSIYRFQGANLENFLGFARRYPGATVINLQTGYRCHDKTYELAYQLTTAMTPLADEWMPECALANFQKNAGVPVILTESPSRESEILNIFERVQNLIKSGEKPENIAIIYRNNSQADLLTQFADQLGIPYEIEGGSDVLAGETVLQVWQILQFLADLSREKANDVQLYQLLWLPAWDLDELAIIQLARECKSEKTSLLRPFFDDTDIIWANLAGNGVKSADITKIQLIGQKFKKLAKLSQISPVTRTIQELLETTGYLAWLRARPDAVTRRVQLYTFWRQMGDWERTTREFNLDKLLENLELMTANHLKLPLQDLDVKCGAITLTTAHKAKGREWAYVFLYNVNRGVWDGTRERVKIQLPDGIVHEQSLDEKTATLDEQKRLFYVALTRAKKQNFVSFHLTETSDGATRQLQPADLAYWLTDQEAQGLVARQPELLAAAQVNQRLEKLLAPPPARDWSAAARAYLQARVQQLQMSATMLNDYLSDPETFLERHVLQAPREADSVQLYFGNAMHHTLEQTLQPVLNNHSPLAIGEMEAIFAADFGKNDIDEPDKSTWQRLGLESLSAWRAEFLASGARPQMLERTFGKLPEIRLGEIPLTGKIDRIDKLGTDEYRVIDYKTGSHQTMNTLLGKTASAKLSERERALPEAIRSPYKRQLLFYKLLCELAPDFPGKVTTGSLHFVKLEKGKIDTRDFALTADELTQLKELIQTVWQEIQNLEFLDKSD